ncbi:methyl-accepting chemotaxis protein [Pelosinus sp. IPA-1]|uniref:methyl-accepting chemotaxis protein n=1 Tax=Pelosinus sp. IPA-1 TaxID=3029569 RepID=UPI00243619E0|nr:methyl-accepting chemotaxis protein [Pelosinus sp. IPA-1]GMA99073.1 chemotaxis protein [Pelosinus sp. IPA-1]
MADYIITSEMAGSLARFIYQNTNYHIIICNQDAMIVGDSDSGKRLGTKHEGSQKILSGHLDEYVVTTADVQKNPTLKEGQNYPIEVDGQRVGTFAIAGQLDYVRPIAKVVVALLSSRLKQAKQIEIVQGVAHAVSRNVEQAVAAIEGISASSQELAANTESVVNVSHDSVRRVKDTGKILDMSRKIATQTKLLSLNASIEAARAGNYGRGFAVVAQEMQNLAQNSADATENINKILQEIQESIQKVIDGINQSAVISNKQAGTMQDIIKVVQDVQTSSADLVAAFERNE